METPQTEKSNPEVCQMRIMFPIVSDQHAIDTKAKIKEAIGNIPDVVITFSIMTLPSKRPDGMGL